VNREEKSETSPAVPPNRATKLPPNGESNGRKSTADFRAKLPFFRMMLWVLVYATAALFLISLILLGGFRLQTKIIGGALLACVALVVGTYVLQWRD
jgi:hypothetical protein